MAPVGSVPAAIPTTYIDSGTVASEIDGAKVAPMIEPVAKMTAEFAPVSACAAARRITLDRAGRRRKSHPLRSYRSSAISTQARPNALGLIDMRYYEARFALNQPMQTGVRHASDAHWTGDAPPSKSEAAVHVARRAECAPSTPGIRTMPIDDRPTIAAPDNDPYLWLEEIEGERALDFVEQQSKRTLERFGNAGFADDRDALAAIYDRPDNIPYVSRRGG